MANKDQEKAFQIIGGRSVWEQKQRLYYLMRHDGLPRLNKPFPKASDAHFPLIDMTIADLKPFWMSQVFSGNRLADFIPLKQELMATAESASDYFSFQMRYFTDFRYRIEQAVDKFLQCGRSVFKPVWNPFKSKIEMRAIDPQFIIMGDDFDDFDEADEFIEVQTLTVEQYRRSRKYDVSDSLIDKIKGKSDWTSNQFWMDKKLREGITHSVNPDHIVLWNRYQQTQSGWILQTKCPFEWDVEICKDQKVPYEWQGETLLPYYSLTMEIKDAGWYSPRGIAELNAAFEAYCTKLWNDTADYMTYANTPMFTSATEIPNGGNIRFQPGEYIPGMLQEVQRSQPPLSFSEQINFTRGLSERRSRTPDFGQFAPDEGGQGGKPITATQSRITAGLQAVGADHNGDTFREVRLSKIFKHLWALHVQYKPTNIAYFIGNELRELPQQALTDQVLVIPAGGNGAKQERIQRATARYQLLRGDPDIDQVELKKELISADDARLVTKLVIGKDVQQGKESEDEAMEIGIMIIGFPATVGPGEDHATRIAVLVGFLQKAQVTGQPVDPIAKQRILQHLAEHFQILQQTQPKVASQLKQQVMQMEQQMAQAQPGQPNGNGRGITPAPPTPQLSQ